MNITSDYCEQTTSELINDNINLKKVYEGLISKEIKHSMARHIIFLSFIYDDLVMRDRYYQLMRSAA